MDKNFVKYIFSIRNYFIVIFILSIILLCLILFINRDEGKMNKLNKQLIFTMCVDINENQTQIYTGNILTSNYTIVKNPLKNRIYSEYGCYWNACLHNENILPKCRQLGRELYYHKKINHSNYLFIFMQILVSIGIYHMFMSLVVACDYEF